MADLVVTDVTNVEGGIAHDAAYTANPVAIGAFASAATPSAVSTDGDMVHVWAGTRGQLAVMLVDSAGAALTTGIQYVENVALTADAAQGTLVIARRDDALSALTPVEGDAVGLRVDSQGALWTAIGAALPAGTNNIGDVDVLTVPAPLSTTGGGTEATALRVTVANDSTGVLSVDDNGASLTIDGAVTASGATASDAALTANPLTMGGRASTAVPAAVSADGDVVDARFLRTGALTVHVVDAAGAAASLGGGTQYVGDAAATATPTGTMAMGLANAAAPADVSANADAVAAWYLRNGSAVVNLASGGTLVTIGQKAMASSVPVVIASDQTVVPVSGPTAADAALTASPVTIGARASTAVPTAVSADGDVVDLRALRTGALTVHVVDAAGAAASLGGGTQYTEDAAFGGNGTGTLMIARRDDALSALTPIEDDAVGLRVNNQGALWTAIGAALPAGTNNIGDVDVLSVPAPLSTTGGGTEAAALRVTIATDSTGVVSVDDNGASLTVDGTVAVSSLPASTNTIEVVGDVAQDVAIAGNPLPMGARASTAVPTAMSADGDSVYVWANRSGAQMVSTAPHIGLNSDPWNLVHETAQYTTLQTSTVLVAGGASEKIVVTKVQIQVGGTTAGTLQLYFGTAAYSRGTSRAIFDGEFAPSNSLKPGVIMDGPFIAGTNGDDLMVTTSAAINPLTITVWYYVVT